MDREFMMRIDAGFEALRNGHQVTREAWISLDDHDFLVAANQGPFLVYRLKADNAGLWKPTNDDLEAEDYIICEDRRRLKPKSEAMRISNACRALHQGYAITREEGMALLFKDGKLLRERGGICDPYQLTPQDIAATNWQLHETRGNNLREVAHG